MSSLVCVVFLLFLQFIWIDQGVTAKIYMSKGNASSLCALATPGIFFTENGTYLNVSTNDFRPENGEKFWVGYVKVFEAFQYRGCTFKTNAGYRRYLRIEASPGNCYSFCRTEHIGLSGTICYCIPQLDTSRVDLTRNGCYRTCTHQPQALCGWEYYELLSIYTKVTYYSNNNNRTDDETYTCLSLNKFKQYQEWSNCSMSYRSVCIQAVSHLPILNSVYNTWSTVMEFCLNNASVPVFRTTSFDTTYTDYFWIGEVRSLVITHPSVKSNDKVRSHGVLEFRNGLFYLNFESDFGAQHQALCPMKTTESTSTSSNKDLTTDSTAISSTLNHNNSVTIQETTEYTPITSRKDPATDSTSTSKPANQDDFLSIKVSLAVVVPVVLIILAVIVVCCICKRRKKSAKAQKDNQYTNQHTTDPASQGSVLNLEPVHPKKNASLQRTHNDGGYELADEFVATIHNKPTADDTYDHTSDQGQQAAKSDNIYNKSEQCNTYDTNDHTHDREGQINVTENIYNKTESEDTNDTTGRNKAIKPGTDNIYNMTQSDDMYNTPGEATGNIFNTDNVYDTTNNDAYSQIDRKKVPTSITDK